MRNKGNSGRGWRRNSQIFTARQYLDDPLKSGSRTKGTHSTHIERFNKVQVDQNLLLMSMKHPIT